MELQEGFKADFVTQTTYIFFKIRDELCPTRMSPSISFSLARIFRLELFVTEDSGLYIMKVSSCTKNNARILPQVAKINCICKL